MRTALLTTIAGLTLAAIPGVYMLRTSAKNDKAALSPGAASPGHALMEKACGECHAGERGDVQSSCVRCHSTDLGIENDTHAASRFDDPSRAGDLARLDATRCSTCHLEHRPHLTDAQSVTVPKDFCVVCHQDVLTSRPTHSNLDKNGCATAGCHRYHDNRSLYTELLKQHVRDPELLPEPRVLVPRAVPSKLSTEPELTTVLAKVPDANTPVMQEAVRQWRGSAHARAGVMCAGCHAPEPADEWIAKPALAVCERCHAAEKATFGAGKHGMRTALNLPVLRTDDAKLPMHDSAKGRSLSCTSCHKDHAFSVTVAAIDGCESCHNDKHTQAFRASPHFTAWKREQDGAGAPGSGVSCATCHLPRGEAKDAATGVRADHDQNRTLRPRDKMAAAVCGKCHGLPFSLAALADDQLVTDNFNRKPGPVRTGFDFIRTANVDVNRRGP